MKKLLLFVFTNLLLISFSQGQSIGIVFESPDTIKGNNYEDIDAVIYFQNTGNTTNTYFAEKIEVAMHPDHDAFFCWSIACYPAFVFMSTDSVVLDPGEVDTTLKGSVQPYVSGAGVDGISVVKYRIFNGDDPTDEYEKTWVYSAQTMVSLDPSDIEKNVLTYPNPARSELNIVHGDLYGKRAEIVIRNVLGSKVLSQPMGIEAELLPIDIQKLNNGIYLYSIVIDGNPVLTKKFTVRK